MKLKTICQLFVIATLLLSSFALIDKDAPASAAMIDPDITWSDVEAGRKRQPTVTIAQSIYPESAANNKFETGVQFWINGEIDARHRNRPSGWDATGPNEGSTFHIFPGTTLSSGDVIEARWIDINGQSHISEYTVPATGTTTPDTTGTTTPDTTGTTTPDTTGTTTPDTTDGDNAAPPAPTVPEEDVFFWSNGIEAEDVAIWDDVEPGDGREPTISLPGWIYPKTALDNDVERGVQFLINGQIDERHPNRPNGWDATGQLEGSSFHMYPALALAPGDELEARWIDRNDVSYYTTMIVGGAIAAEPADTPTDETVATPEPAPTSAAAPIEAADADVGWFDMEPGSGREPTLVVGGSVYPVTASSNSSEVGVQFLFNGVIDERHPNRPNGWDATGPREGSSFHMFPELTLTLGDVIEARWVDLDGISYFAQATVGGDGAVAPAPTAPAPAPTPAPAPAPTPTATPDDTTPVPTPPPSSAGGDRGPTGQWPSQYGFPAYNTAATVVTNGTMSGLHAAIKQLDGTGGVIEHPGHITNLGTTGLSRSKSAPIVIRPPLGQRAEYNIDTNVYLRGDGMLLAGWYHKSGSIYPYDVVNSGAAWLESDGGGQFRVTARFEADRTVTGLWYEGVYRNYLTGVGYDRSTINAISPGTETRLDAVGLWLAGHARTVGSAAHVDTMQIVEQNGGDAGASIRNSVIWPSSNVAFQGTGDTGFTITNTWFVEPQFGRSMFPTGDPGAGLDGHGAITGGAVIIDSTMLGNTHPSSTVHISGSELYIPGTTYNDWGGNTTLTDKWQAPAPAAPTHQQLDNIWHP